MDQGEPGENIVQYGFGPLSFTMLEHGLLGRAAPLGPPTVRRHRPARGPSLSGLIRDQVRSRPDKGPEERDRHPLDVRSQTLAD